MSLVLYDFEPGFELEEVEARDVDLALANIGTGVGLRMVTGHSIEWPGITLKPPGDSWDISGFQRLRLAVTNTGPNPVSVGFRIDNPGGDGNRNCVQVVESFTPGESRIISADLSATPWILSPPVELVGMRGAPGRMAIDPGNIIQLIVFVPQPDEDHEFVIDDISAEGGLEELDSSTFFPFIDRYGQYMHRDWPGKVQGEDDLARRRPVEAEDLAAHPGPPDRNVYGGWLAGPQLEASGFFRVQKHEGRWWLVDPDGRLFWSHGIDCVSLGVQTGTSDREHYFQELPVDPSPLTQFYGRGGQPPHGYYRDRAPYTTFSHQRANLYRKYGESWTEDHRDIAHRRLRSWGMNTIANWSAPGIYLQRRTPYVATVHIGARELEGSEGYWSKFHDVFDPSFRASIRRQLADMTEEVGDPWCMGFFVDNELSWGDEISLSLAALASPADQPAKIAFAADLRSRYSDIEKLNQAWGTDHASWDALLQDRDTPDGDGARDDLVAFYARTAQTYFRTIKEELTRAAPNQLYLGCRFAWVNARAARTALDFCDVVSYNRYADTVEGLALPENSDRPVIIGEFHFGALDRGMFHTGLRGARDQDHRAELYRSYVQGALRDPLIVGTHWFQYQDQPTTGRFDDENYQIGFIDICDTPHEEIVRVSREVGEELYEYRLRGGR